MIYRLWDRLLGKDADRLRKGLDDGTDESRRKWLEQRRITGKRYGLLSICLLFTACGVLISAPDPGKLKAVLQVGSIVETSDGSVEVDAYQDWRAEKLDPNVWRMQIEEVLRAQNPTFPDMEEDLKLPLQLSSGGETIRWSSGDLSLLHADGTVDWLRIGDGAETFLVAESKLDGTMVSHRLPVRFLPPAEPILRDRMRKELSIVIDRAENDPAHLPLVTDQGLPIDWKPAAQRGPFLALGLYPLLFVAVYRARFGRLEKESAAAKKQIARELPELVERLALLLYAGCVTETAIRRLVALGPTVGASGQSDQSSINLMYRSLADICRQVDVARAPFGAALSEAANRSGVREWARVATIIADSMDKGSTLAEKLEDEAVLLRSARMYQREADSRTAETQLVLPMVLLLVSLLLITTGPVLLAM